MERITELAASLSLWQYILIYAAAFVIAIIAAAVGGKKSRHAREALIAISALFGGMLAVGYVSARLGKNPGIFVILILAFFAALIGVPAALISGSNPVKEDTEKDTPAKKHKEKEKKEKPDPSVGREAELRRKAEKLLPGDISGITDEALLCAYVRYVKTSSRGYSALEKIEDDTYLIKIALDNSVDIKLQRYALEHIKSDELKASVVRLHRNDWIGQEAAYNIKSPETRLELFREFPGLYLPNGKEPLILKYILENHLYADDSMDVTIGRKDNEKGVIYYETMRSQDRELIDMLDPQGWDELANICLSQVEKFGYRKNPPGNEIRKSLECLKLLYGLNLCESRRSEIEALDGQTFNKYDIVNYYNERERCDGIEFHLSD